MLQIPLMKKYDVTINNVFDESDLFEEWLETLSLFLICSLRLKQF